MRTTRRSTQAAAVFLLLTAAEAAASTEWLRDEFVERRVEVTRERRSFGLLDDGCLDLRVFEREGRPVLLLLQPGTIVAKAESEVDHGASALKQFARLDPAELAGLSLDLGADERPVPLVRECPLVPGRVLFVRTIRPDLGGGGAAARVVVEQLSPAAAPLRATLTIDVLALDPAKSRLPRRGDGFYDQHVGQRSGVVTLFPFDLYGHPTFCTFDVHRLDRDHLEWSGALPRDVVVSTPGRLAWCSSISLGPGAPDEAPIRVAKLGFEREVTLAPSDSRAPRAQFDWHWSERKGDASQERAGFLLTLLSTSGDPVPGAWVSTRDAASSQRRDADAFYCVQSDFQGRALLPLSASADPRTVELLAFEAGTRARFGTRRGAIAQSGSGDECVVLLERDEQFFLRVAPPPPFACLVGVQFATGSFLVRLGTDGRLQLPATGHECVLQLGAPYVRQVERFELEPDGGHGIRATLAAGRERRVRVIDARDGRELSEVFLAQGDPEPNAFEAVVLLSGSFIVRPEFAGAVLDLGVGAPGHAPRQLVLAADAPRDQDFALEPEPTAK